jgi:hypothetical protein
VHSEPSFTTHIEAQKAFGNGDFNQRAEVLEYDMPQKIGACNAFARQQTAN